ncbi:MAG: NUDIX domain-containing protein [Bdellovibrionota bacterium]
MAKKTRKAQVVICGYDAQSQSLAYLLMQTNKKRGQFWQNVTGKIDPGESYEEGALREVVEETALKPEWLIHFIDLKLSHEFIDQRNRDCHENCYLAIVDRLYKVKIDPHEHQDHKWEKEISRDSVLHQGNFEALEKAIKLIQEEFN